MIPAIGADATVLLKSSSLQRLSDRTLASFASDWTKVPPVKDFKFSLRNLDPLRAELRKLGMTEANVAAIEFADDGLLDLDLRGLPVENLSFLKSLPIKSLNLGGCNVSDLSPLAGAPLRSLNLTQTKVSDLKPLRGAPLEFLELYTAPVSDLSPLAECQTLRELRMTLTQVSDLTPILKLPITVVHLYGTKVADLAPLVGCTKLEAIGLPDNAKGVEALRKLPRLQRISSRYDTDKDQVAQSADEFWREFDARSTPRKGGVDELKIPPAEVTADQIGALAKRANTHLRAGRFIEAAADFNRLAELEPTNMRLLSAVPNLLQAGDLETYRRLCRRGLDAFASSSDMEARERITKICVLGESGSDVGVTLKLADSALEMGAGNNVFLPWAYLTKSMAEYRAGRFTESVQSAEAAFGYDKAPPVVKGTSQAVLAMAYQHLQRPKDAQVALARATELMGDSFAQPLDVAPVVPAASWQDWLIGRLMVREAQAVVTGRPGESLKR
jgi:tetratricopeptide (TPR) repeat protein